MLTIDKHRQKCRKNAEKLLDALWWLEPDSKGWLDGVAVLLHLLISEDVGIPVHYWYHKSIDVYYDDFVIGNCPALPISLNLLKPDSALDLLKQAATNERVFEKDNGKLEGHGLTKGRLTAQILDRCLSKDWDLDKVKKIYLDLEYLRERDK